MKKINRSARLFVIASVSILFATVIAFGQNTEPAGTKWLLTEIDGSAIVASKAYIELNNDKTRFSGNNGCNRMFGGMQLAAGKLTIGNIGSTRMACLDADGDLEQQFMAELSGANGLRQNGETLELLNNERVVLKFKSSNPETMKLEDKKWFLQSIKGTAIELTGDKPFIAFDAGKQSAGGNTGCNVFGGSYSSEGNKLLVKNTFQTMRACIEDNRMEIERAFLDELARVSTFEIKDGKLYLKNGDSVLLILIGKDK